MPTARRPRLVSALLLSGLLAGLNAASAQSARQSTLVYGGDFSDLLTLDPGMSYEFSGSLIDDNLYETLVKFEGSDLSTLKPGLARRWTVKDAGKTWKVTFELRPGKFASGRPVTAADVVYSFDRAVALKGNGSFLFTDVANIAVGSTVAANPSTVVVTLPKTASPNAFLNLLTFNIGGVVDSVEVKRHAVNNDYGSGWLKTHSAGSGPFVLNRWDQGQQVALDANPNATLKPKLRRVILRNISEANAQKIALESGEIDIAQNLTPDMFKAAVGDARFQTLKSDSLRLQYLAMNSGAGSPFADARVRRAVRYAIDQDGIVSGLLGGLGRKTQTIIPYGLFGASQALPYEHSVAKARALLAAAGKANGFSVEFLVPSGVGGGGVPYADLAAKLQADLAAVGIKANIRQIVESELLNLYRAQKSTLLLEAWSPDFPDPDGNVTPMSDYATKSLAYRTRWNSPAAAKLAHRAALETDPKKRAALYAQLMTLQLNDGPFAILYQPSVPIVLSNKVKGFVRNAQGQVRFEAISKLP